MIIIKVYLHNTRGASFFNAQSISAKLYGLEVKKMIYFHFGKVFGAVNGAIYDWDVEKIGWDDKDSCANSVTLYSEGDLLKFKTALDKSKFASSKNYCFLSNNCADAINWMLDYFFPQDKYVIDIVCGFGKFLCAFGFLGLLLGCCPPPPGINMPQFVFDKAVLLSCLCMPKPELSTFVKVIPELPSVEAKKETAATQPALVK